jgi:hypothetical protein
MTSNDTPENKSKPVIGTWVAIGIALGAGIGVAINNIAVGVGTGIARAGGLYRESDNGSSENQA